MGENNSKRIGDTIVYKHKYLTMPNKTKADAIEEVAKDLKEALEGRIPQSNIDKETIEKLMEIFKKNAEATKNEDVERQRLHKRKASEQRVYPKNKQQELTPPAEFEKENPAFNTQARGEQQVRWSKHTRDLSVVWTLSASFRDIRYSIMRYRDDMRKPSNSTK